MASKSILKTSDFALVRLSGALSPLFKVVGEMEFEFFSRELKRIDVQKPVFVTGLARSGTTMMLNVLSQADGVATHRYRDFPFLHAPLAWNWFQDRMKAGPEAAVERPHKDRIRITKDSADAFEEPLWQGYFPWAHDAGRLHVMDSSTANPSFEDAFPAHLKKILWLRKGARYLSKGNYNVGRIAYLAKLFPDARFVVPVRDPYTHVRSLVKQHELFCGYAKDDPRVPAYLAAAGHYEFGPQRRPVNLDPARLGEIEAAWRAGDEYRGYARQWAQVYAHVARLREDPRLRRSIHVVRYEDLCARPREIVPQVLAFCALEDSAGRVEAAARELAAPVERPYSDRAAEAAVREEAQAVAERFGYESTGLARAA